MKTPRWRLVQLLSLPLFLLGATTRLHAAGLNVVKGAIESVVQGDDPCAAVCSPEAGGDRDESCRACQEAGAEEQDLDPIQKGEEVVWREVHQEWGKARFHHVYHATVTDVLDDGTVNLLLESASGGSTETGLLPVGSAVTKIPVADIARKQGSSGGLAPDDTVLTPERDPFQGIPGAPWMWKAKVWGVFPDGFVAIEYGNDDAAKDDWFWAYDPAWLGRYSGSVNGFGVGDEVTDIRDPFETLKVLAVFPGGFRPAGAIVTGFPDGLNSGVPIYVFAAPNEFKQLGKMSGSLGDFTVGEHVKLHRFPLPWPDWITSGEGSVIAVRSDKQLVVQLDGGKRVASPLRDFSRP